MRSRLGMLLGIVGSAALPFCNPSADASVISTSESARISGRGFPSEYNGAPIGTTSITLPGNTNQAFTGSFEGISDSMTVDYTTIDSTGFSFHSTGIATSSPSPSDFLEAVTSGSFTLTAPTTLNIVVSYDSSGGTASNTDNLFLLSNANSPINYLDLEHVASGVGILASRNARSSSGSLQFLWRRPDQWDH